MNTYTITDLHVDGPWGTSSRANAIVNTPLLPHIVGDTLDGGHAVMWTQGPQHSMKDLDPNNTFGHEAHAFATNSKGEAVGCSATHVFDDPPEGYAFYYHGSKVSPMINLVGPLASRRMLAWLRFRLPPWTRYGPAYARGINDTGVIVGHAMASFLRLLTLQYTVPVMLPVFWHRPFLGVPSFLPTPLPRQEGRATAISPNNTIVGQCVDPVTGNLHACRWDEAMGTFGAPTELPPAINPNGAPYKESYAWAISSDSKIIVGASGDSIKDQTDSYACVWQNGAEVGVQFGTQATPVQRAKLLYSGQNPPLSIAYGVNKQGQIVGLSPGKHGFPYTAFFYDGTAEPDDLLNHVPNAGHWFLVAGRGITDIVTDQNGNYAGGGQIVGVGSNGNHQAPAHAFVLTPIM